MLELNQENFQSEVIDASHTLPVLVDFWADWCAPCKMLAPVLDQLAADYQGLLKIAKVNTDEQRGLAEANGIRSLPTLRLYRNGAAVEELLGAQPESVLRQVVEAYLVRPSDSGLQAALDLAADGKPGEAIAAIGALITEDPENSALAVELARLCIRDGQTDRAGELIDGLPRDLREGTEGLQLQALLEFARTAEGGAPAAELERKLVTDPEDAQCRYQLAARQVIAADYDAALDNLIELLKRHRTYGDDAARRGLLAVFSLLGDADERVTRYRRKMASLLL